MFLLVNIIKIIIITKSSSNSADGVVLLTNIATLAIILFFTLRLLVFTLYKVTFTINIIRFYF